MIVHIRLVLPPSSFISLSLTPPLFLSFSPPSSLSPLSLSPISSPSGGGYGRDGEFGVPEIQGTLLQRFPGPAEVRGLKENNASSSYIVRIIMFSPLLLMHTHTHTHTHTHYLSTGRPILYSIFSLSCWMLVCLI